MHVALLSHVLIAWDRQRFIESPLRGRLPSFVCSCATWLTGMIIALPFPIYTTYLDLGVSVVSGAARWVDAQYNAIAIGIVISSRDPD